MSEANEPVTDRIEAIRARHAARLRTRALPPDWALVNEDMAVLLAEVERLTKVLEDVRDAANGRIPGLKAFDPWQHPDVALRDVLLTLDPLCTSCAHPHADYCPLTEADQC